MAQEQTIQDRYNRYVKVWSENPDKVDRIWNDPFFPLVLIATKRVKLDAEGKFMGFQNNDLPTDIDYLYSNKVKAKSNIPVAELVKTYRKYFTIEEMASFFSDIWGNNRPQCKDIKKLGVWWVPNC